jgi:hypothetical protein
MQFAMHPDMVYEYPIWAIGLLLMCVAVLGAVLIELCARRVVPNELRRRHNDVAAAIFSIIGVTYAVLLAFVAMLAWEGYNRAKAASYAEAALIGDVYNVSAGLVDPEKSSVRDDIIGYARHVVTVEWPMQAEGKTVNESSVYLDRLNTTTLAPRAGATDGDLHSLLLQLVARVWDARQERLLAAQTSIPDIVWFVMIAGGALTIAFGSFLGAPSLRMQLAMSAVLAASGTLVLILIIALSNPFRGDFRVSTAPFEHVLSRMAEGETGH